MSTGFSDDSAQGEQEHQSNVLSQALAQMERTGDVPSSASVELGLKSKEEDGEGAPTVQDTLDELAKQEAGEKDQGEGEVEEGSQEEAGEEGIEASDSQSEDQPQDDKQTIMANGKELEVDWNDREAIVRVLQKGAAYHQEKRDKDLALESVRTEQAAHQETATERDAHGEILGKIEQAKDLGPEAVIRLLFNKDLADFQDEWAERAGWSDDKKEAHAEGMRVRKLESEMAAMVAATEADKEAAADLRVEAVRKGVQNNFEASYREHSLDNALGDPELEDELNDRLFTKVKSQFNDMELSDISPANVEAAFKSERSRLLRVYKKASAAKVSASIENKKKEALGSAQARAASGAPKKTAKERFKAASNKQTGWRDIISNPDLLSQL